MVEVRVGQRGEIVIPKRIRERYGIKAGGTVILQETVGGFTLRPKSFEEEIKDTSRRWAHYRVHNVSKWDLSKEPYEDEDEQIAVH